MPHSVSSLFPPPRRWSISSPLSTLSNTQLGHLEGRCVHELILPAVWLRNWLFVRGM